VRHKNVSCARAWRSKAQTVDRHNGLKPTSRA
jgi:hypothetical protein